MSDLATGLIVGTILASAFWLFVIWLWRTLGRTALSSLSAQVAAIQSDVKALKADVRALKGGNK